MSESDERQIVRWIDIERERKRERASEPFLNERLLTLLFVCVCVCMASNAVFSFSFAFSMISSGVNSNLAKI